MVAHLDAVTSLAVDVNGLYLISGSKFYFNRNMSLKISCIPSVGVFATSKNVMPMCHYP